MQKLNKEEVLNYYQNHTFKDTYIYFNTSHEMLDRFFKDNGLQKRNKNFNMSEDRRKERSLKISQSLKLRYSDPIKKEETVNKIKSTSIERYGVDDYVKTQESKEKTKQTNLKKYGVEYHTQTKEWKEAKINSYSNMSEEEMKEFNLKRSSTMLERYGVEWFCMHPDSRNKNKRNSNPNLEFKQLLEENGFIIDEKENREFHLGHFQYDFKINNILIEINPSVTHNSTFGIYKSKPLGKEYHYNKTKLALDNGYKCIQVFDWVDKNEVINLLRSNFDQKFIGVRKYIYNLTTKEYRISDENLDKTNWNLVEIYDDGFEIIKL